MEKDGLRGLPFSVGLVVNCEYTDSLGKMKQVTGVVKSVSKEQFTLLLNQQGSSAFLPLGKELFLTIPPASDTQSDSHQFVCYVIDEDKEHFPMLALTPPIERPKTAQSFYCRVKLPLLYFINKIEFSGEIINLSVLRFFAVVDYNPELKSGMMLNFQLALPSKIYTNLVGEILRVHKLTNNQMAIVVTFLNTPPDFQSAIVKYLFQRQHELAQSKQPIVIEPKKSTRKTSSSLSSIDEPEIRPQILGAYLDDQPYEPEDETSLMDRMEPTRISVFQGNGGSGKKSFKLAGFWIRGMAFVLDLLILTVIGAFATVLFALIAALIFHASLIGDTWSKILNPTSSFLTGFSIIIGFALYWSYFTILESSQSQASFGKRRFGIIVTTEKGRPISLGTAGKRALVRIFSIAILFIGFIMVGLSPQKRALHDLLTKTIVIKVE